jgi:hypothetical protein
MWNGALPFATASYFVAKDRGETFAYFHTVAGKRYSSMQHWLFGLPGRILCEESLDVKENDEYALDFAFHLSSFIGLGEFGLSVQAHAFFLKLLSNHYQGLRRTFFRDLHKLFRCSFVESIAKSHQARYTTPNKRT